MSARTTILLAALAAALGGLTACGGDEPARPAAKVPAGFQAAAGKHWSFAYPEGWSRVAAEPEAGEDLIGFESEPGAGGLPSQVGIGVNAAYRNELASAVRLAKDESRIVYPEYEVLDERSFEVAGGKAHRIDARYSSFQEDPVEVRTADLLVQTDDGVQLNFFVRGPAADFERLGLGRILDSFRVR